MSEISSQQSRLCRHVYVCIDIEVTWDSFLNEPKMFINKAYDIPILTKKKKKITFVLIVITKLIQTCF